MVVVCRYSLVRYHYDDIIMGTIASQITSLTIVNSTVYSGADQSKHQSSASATFVWGIHRGAVNSPHKWPVTRKMFPFDDVIMMVYKILHWFMATKYAMESFPTNPTSQIISAYFNTSLHLDQCKNQYILLHISYIGDGACIHKNIHI